MAWRRVRGAGGLCRCLRRAWGRPGRAEERKRSVWEFVPEAGTRTFCASVNLRCVLAGRRGSRRWGRPRCRAFLVCNFSAECKKSRWRLHNGVAAWEWRGRNESRRASSGGPPGNSGREEEKCLRVCTRGWNEDVLRLWQPSLRPPPGEEGRGGGRGRELRGRALAAFEEAVG